MYGYLCKTTGLWYGLALPVIAGLLTFCLLREGDDEVGMATHALTLAGSGLLVSYLLWPMLWRNAAPDLGDLGRWLALTMLGSLPLLPVTPVHSWSSLALPLLAGVLVLCLFLGALTLVLQRLATIPGHYAHRGLTCLLLVAAAAPLWLGPLASQQANLTFTNLVVALSPASYLANLIGHDLFRSTWFYAHTPLGGLRYAYPDTTAMTLFYCGTSALLLSLSGVLARRHSRAVQNPDVSHYSLHKELSS